MYRYTLAGLIAFFTIFFVYGCASQQNVGATSPAQPAVSLQIPQGMAALYLFNDSGWTLIPGNQDITDNGKPIASLPRQTYTRFFITPGPHVLRPDPFLWKQEVSLHAEPGASYYIVIGYRPERSWALPLAGSPLLMKQLSEEEAQPLMREMKPR